MAIHLQCVKLVQPLTARLLVQAESSPWEQLGETEVAYTTRHGILVRRLRIPCPLLFASTGVCSSLVNCQYLQQPSLQPLMPL